MKKRSEKTDKTKIDKKFIENTHLELNSIKENFNSLTSSANSGDVPDSRRESMQIDLLDIDENEPENVDLIDLNHDVNLNTKHNRNNDNNHNHQSQIGN